MIKRFLTYVVALAILVAAGLTYSKIEDKNIQGAGEKQEALGMLGQQTGNEDQARPSDSVNVTGEASITPTVTLEEPIEVTPEVTPTETPEVTPEEILGETPEPTGEPSPEVTMEAGFGSSPEGTPAQAATNTPTPAVTSTPTPTVTNTPIPTATSTPTPTATKTPTPTATNTPKPTATKTPTPTATNTPKPTATKTPTPTATNTPTPTPTKVATSKPSSTPTKVPTNSPTPTKQLTANESVQKGVASTKSINGADVVKYAAKWLGKQYIPGGRDLSVGTDCSGFTHLVYKYFGLTLPTVASSQAVLGEEVTFDQLKPGDLIGSIGHSSIYVGFGITIEARDKQYGIILANNSVGTQYGTTYRRIYNNTFNMSEEKWGAELFDICMDTNTVYFSSTDTLGTVTKAQVTRDKLGNCQTIAFVLPKNNNPSLINRKSAFSISWNDDNKQSSYSNKFYKNSPWYYSAAYYTMLPYVSSKGLEAIKNGIISQNVPYVDNYVKEIDGQIISYPSFIAAGHEEAEWDQYPARTGTGKFW